MSRLLALKEWITLEEGAGYISALFIETVTISDLYRFALAGHLTLSVNFVNHGRANLGKKVLIREAGFTISASLNQDVVGNYLPITVDALPEFDAWLAANEEGKKALSASEPKAKTILLKGEQISATECVVLDDTPAVIEGIWDLTMVGAERIDIEHYLQSALAGPEVAVLNLGGVLLSRPDGTYARLLERFGEARPFLKNSYFPAGSLPQNAPLVIRSTALNDFVARASGPTPASNKLDARERKTLLCIIGALAKEAKLDLSEPYKAAEAVAKMLPGDVKLKPRSIGDHLKEVPEALESRRT